MGVCIEVECVDGLVISGTRTVIDGCMRFEVYVKVRNEMMAMKSSVWVVVVWMKKETFEM